jgi:iron-sulfur cluster insertion protein
MAMTMTQAAALRISELTASDGRPGAFFRVMVSGGGCQGFQYVMDVDDAGMDGDEASELAGQRLVVDGASAQMLGGSVLDWVETLAGERFEITNPNASSSCGCGVSFS